MSPHSVMKASSGGAAVQNFNRSASAQYLKMKTDREDEIVKAHGPVLLSKQKTFGWGGSPFSDRFRKMVSPRPLMGFPSKKQAKM